MKGQLHWVCEHEECEVREFDKLFEEGEADLLERFNQKSYTHLKNCLVGTGKYEVGQRFQFERQGYYIVDEVVDGRAIFNKIVSLKK